MLTPRQGVMTSLHLFICMPVRFVEVHAYTHTHTPAATVGDRRRVLFAIAHSTERVAAMLLIRLCKFTQARVRACRGAAVAVAAPTTTTTTTTTMVVLDDYHTEEDDDIITRWMLMLMMMGLSTLQPVPACSERVAGTSTHYGIWSA